MIHSLDITVALGGPAVAPAGAVLAGLEQLAAADCAVFGVDLTDARTEATDATWARGSGRTVRADSGSLVALLGGRTLPDGRAPPRTPRRSDH